MNVSVVIPVYNAEQYLPNAIDSALAQPEVQQVVLIEDGSTDDSLLVCRKYAEQHRRVELFRHPGGVNRGAGATRNLGIIKATQDYLAFLDADDVYLAGRFQQTRQILSENPEAHGVYESVGTKYLDASMREEHLSHDGETIGMRKQVAPDAFFRALAMGRYGYVHLDGLTLKRAAIDPVLFFDPGLLQCQDTDFMFRIAQQLTLYGGMPESIVALRGIHRSNRIFNRDEARYYRRMFFRKCIRAQFFGSRDPVAQLYILSRMIGAQKFYRPFKSPRIIGLPVKLLAVGGYLLWHPNILVTLLSSFLRRE